MNIQRHNNTESINTTTDKQYFLSEEDSWAYCPYQRFFAKSINEPLPQHWEAALLNKNNNFKHEYINFHENKQNSNEAHDINDSLMKNLVPSSLSSSSISSLNSFNSTFSKLQISQSHSNSIVTEDDEIDSFELPKPIHVKVEPKFTKSNKSNTSNISKQFNKPLYLGPHISSNNIFSDDHIMIPKHNLKIDNFKHIKKINKINKTTNKKIGLKVNTTT